MSRASATPSRALAIVLIVAANLLGGLSYPAQAAAQAGLPPATVTLLRNLVALACLHGLPWARAAARSPWSSADLRRSAVLGVVSFAAPLLLGIEGLARAGAANASILILLEPITIVAIAWIFLRERIGVRKALGLACGLAGALYILLDGAALRTLFTNDSSLGNLMLVIHGILWGTYTPLAKGLAQRHDALAICARVTWFSLLAIAPAAFLERAHWHAGPELRVSLAWCVGLGVFVSFLATAIWLKALEVLPTTTVAGFVFLQPLAGVLAAVGWRGERLTQAAIVGGLLIVIGVVLDILPGRRGRAVAPGR